MLTPKQISDLEKPFEVKEHRFLSGNPYILKSAIRTRLRQVDPHYTTGAPELLARDGDVVIMLGSLTIGDITHFGVGTGTMIVSTKNETTGEIIPVSPFEAARQMAKAYKQAASDILPRAALEFNCGNYLKDKPKAVKQEGFEDWLKKLNMPSHWADNGGVGRMNAEIFKVGLKWEYIKDKMEPGKVLTRLQDTTLTEEAFIARLNVIVNERDNVTT
jgi:hypothetical protein